VDAETVGDLQEEEGASTRQYRGLIHFFITTKIHYIINAFIVVIVAIKNRKTTQFLDNQNVPSISRDIFGITPSRPFQNIINRVERPRIEGEPFY